VRQKAENDTIDSHRFAHVPHSHEKKIALRSGTQLLRLILLLGTTTWNRSR